MLFILVSFIFYRSRSLRHFSICSALADYTKILRVIERFSTQTDVWWQFKHLLESYTEGHTADLTKAEADKEVREIFELYCLVYEGLLPVLIVPDIKSKSENFVVAEVS
ncbi:hypothetical protein DFH29DRAFT_903988 [Suillus ampliporus]|nr:hypothetical protein DFH29DRAFT_903988 [Suillus ampliporus]